MEDTLYREIILELNRRPLNKKIVTDFDVEQREFNPICGDDITIQLKFDTEGKVCDVGHQGNSCAISLAAVSLVTEEIKGKIKQEVMSLGKEHIFALLGTEIIPTRTQCALLGLTAIQKAIAKTV